MLKSKVAIKFEAASNVTPIGCVEEADIMVELRSKGIHVSQMHDCGIYKGISWIFMDYITRNGTPTTLDSYLHENGKIAESTAIQLLYQLADVLIKMKEIGITHNDIKDSVIFYNSSINF